MKKRNQIFARRKLATTRQQGDQSIDDFLQCLMRLSKECDWRDVTTKQYEEELVRDAFITGLTSPAIRQRLLENENLNLTTAVNQARALDAAHRNSQKFALLRHAAAYATADTPSSGEEPCALAMTKQIRQDNAGKNAIFAARLIMIKRSAPRS